MKKTILQKAQSIVYDRSQERTRQYGDIQQSMKKAAEIASSISNKSYSPDDIYIAIISIKLSRQAHAHKEDNLLDCVAYMSAYNDYLETVEKPGEKLDPEISLYYSFKNI